MTTKITTIATDFFIEAGLLTSITMPSSPSIGDTVVKDGKMYTVKTKAWDFDAGGLPILVRITLDG